MLICTVRSPTWTITEHETGDDSPTSHRSAQVPLITSIAKGHVTWTRSERPYALPAPAAAPQAIRDLLRYQRGFGVFVRLWNPDGEVLTLRSRRVGEDQGKWQSACAESVEVADMGAPPEQWARRAITEEIGDVAHTARQAGVDLVWRNGLYVRWWVYATTDMGTSELLEAARHAPDAWEHEQVIVADRATVAAFASRDTWLHDSRPNHT